MAIFTDFKNNILILDENPVRAARSLIKTHVLSYIPLVQNIFKQFHEKSDKKFVKNNIWVYYMRRSKQNYLWTVCFYKELQEIYRNKISSDNRYYEDKSIKFYDELLDLPNNLPSGRKEICMPKRHLNKYLNNIKKFKIFKENFVNYNKVIYISMNYPDHLFPHNEVPKWYNDIKNNFIYVNPIDNMVVKIKRDNYGDYRYFCRVGLNDYWDEIKNVPPEMKYVINSLIYKNGTIDRCHIEKKVTNKLDKIDKINNYE